MNETREKIQLNENFLEISMKMSEGNPGALNVLMQILEKSPGEIFPLILHLDDMNIRGSQIWVGYKDYCESDIRKFIDCIYKRNKEMIDKINESIKRGSPGWLAVPSGASFNARENFYIKENQHETKKKLTPEG